MPGPSAVDRVFERQLARLVNARVPGVLQGGLRGLEKEALRVTPDGRLAQTPHPAALGSTLCNPDITTDYSESLIELVTPTFRDNAALVRYLCDLQQFVYRNLGDELLWAASMPCELTGDAEVPIARYGRSHEGHFKEVYRRGLLNRYGGMMQAIAGIHFNYSLPADFWPLWAEALEQPRADAAFMSASYFRLLRNFRRHGWLVSLLFGAAPAVASSFLQGRDPEGLESWRNDTLYGEHATTLRMSDIGYRNRNQAAVSVSVNSLDEYLRDLSRAVHTPHAPFAALGVKVDGEYRQLSSNVLQIENEYYSSIRPKRVLHSGELTGHALARAGVEYVEVRVLDLGAEGAESVTVPQLDFMEAFTITLLLLDSQPISVGEQESLDRNYLQVARRGRDPALRLDDHGRGFAPVDRAYALLEHMQGVCELLDAGRAERPYTRALELQRQRLLVPQDLPAARLLRAMQDEGVSFTRQTLQRSLAARATTLAAAVDAVRQQQLQSQAEESLELQRRKDAAVSGSFDDYLQQRLAG
jgi:glutamate--cysteine ligase